MVHFNNNECENGQIRLYGYMCVDDQVCGSVLTIRAAWRHSGLSPSLYKHTYIYNQQCRDRKG